MIHFTKYAETKFEILNKYKVYYTRETVEDALLKPDQVKKKGSYLAARQGDLKVVYKKEGEVVRVVTFYPVK
jgi:hypothetical protein